MLVSITTDPLRMSFIDFGYRKFARNLAVNTANLLGFWNGGSYELYRKMLELDAQTQGSKEECHRKMDKASRKA